MVMGLVPGSMDAVQLTVPAPPGKPMPATFVGGEGTRAGCVGVTKFEGVDSWLVPASVMAATVKATLWPAINPVTNVDVAWPTTVATAMPVVGDNDTRYPVMGLPPVFNGADQDTVAE